MTEPQTTVTEASVGDRPPVVSIGMPVYNGAKYIREALDSLLSQTFVDFELIISDNASTDATQEICEEYARRDLRIRYVKQSENKGALANFQFVLNQAKGEFFMWAAADDKWDEHWIESIYIHICNKKNIAGYGRLGTIDEHGLPLRHPAETANLSYSGARVWRKLAFYLTHEGLGKANLFYALYPRKVLQSIDLGSYRFDYQILFVLLERISYVQISGSCFYKRIHGESEGAGGADGQRRSIFDASARTIRHEIQVATHYLSCTRPGLRAVLFLLIPIKVFISLVSIFMVRVRL